jgi:hypothetical protein
VNDRQLSDEANNHLESVNKELKEVMDVLEHAAGLTSRQLKEVLIGDPSVDPTIVLDREVTFTVGQLCDLWDVLREARFGIHLARGGTFAVRATGQYGAPLDTYTPTPAGLVAEAEDIARQASSQSDD